MQAVPAVDGRGIFDTEGEAMNLAKQLADRGFKPDQIARATVGGKPLDVAEKPHKLDRMNKTEAAYAAHLDWMIHEGHVASYKFESIKLRLARKTWYCPDFFVVLRSGRVEFVEVKGFLRDDAAVKYKTAREMYPQWNWRMVRRGKNGWWEDVNI